jgi:hypothetical protein
LDEERIEGKSKAHYKKDRVIGKTGLSKPHPFKKLPALK